MPLPALLASPFFRTVSLVLLCAATTDYAAAGSKKAPPPRPASQYDTFDAHAKEQVTIAADPCDDAKDCSFFRLPYVQHGLLPIRVIITNDSDRALSLEDARLQFISANKDIIPAATDEDLNRRLFTMKSVRGTKIPMPSPIPSITIHHPAVDKKILEDENDFGFTTTVVNAHSTLAGYLFYDVKNLDDPALKDAEFYIKMIHTLDGKENLFSFTIPFNKWLAAQDKKDKKDKKNQADRALP
jgi:hypothetical protein